MRILLLWDIGRRMFVVGYRRFVATYRSHLQRSSRWDRYVVPKRRQPTTNVRRTTSEEGENLNYIAAKPHFSEAVTSQVSDPSTAELGYNVMKRTEYFVSL